MIVITSAFITSLTATAPPPFSFPRTINSNRSRCETIPTSSPLSFSTGTCRTCLRRALAGTVRYQIEWPGVSPDEKQAGYFLPCVAYPASDLVIGDGIVKPWWD